MAPTSPSRVRHLVLPVAGMGTRLMPLTANRPKALVAVCGKPLLTYVLEEGWASGIREAVLIVSPPHLGDFEIYLKDAAPMFPGMHITIRVQEHPYGDGHAILEAADLLGDAPFAVRFCDDLIRGDEPGLKELIRVFHEHHASVVGLDHASHDQAHRYGVVGVRNVQDAPLYEILKIVEKPKEYFGSHPDLPFALIVIGAYVLEPSILMHLKRLRIDAPEAVDGLRIAFGLQKELESGKRIMGFGFAGKRFDCGTLQGIDATSASFCGKQES